MAVNKKSILNLKPIKKGEVRNPRGGNAHDPELVKLKHLTKEELIDIGNLIIKSDINKLKELAKDDTQTVLRRMLASVSAKIIQKGDMNALDTLLNRLVGKVRDEVKFSGEVGPRVVLTMPSNQRESPSTVVQTIGGGCLSISPPTEKKEELK